MSSDTASEQPLQIPPVCDLCHSRKVRCDRRQPCGNCQDAKAVCSHRRSAKRNKRNISRQERQQERESHQEQSIQSVQLPSVPDLEGNDTPEMPVFERIDNFNDAMCHVSLNDAQHTIWHHLQHLQDLAVNRREILELALSVPGELLFDFGDVTQSRTPHPMEEQPKAPSIELLTWMLRDIENDKFGPFVGDYFRHISMSTLKHMGLTLLRNQASSHETILFTICLNAVAFKFYTTTMNIDMDHDLLPELQKTALPYRQTAQSTLHKIPLLSSPTLALLQALLCGVFLHQGSGDVKICWELTKAACRTCIDLGLETTVLKVGASEEEFYCFIWCYMLDRNYAFKLGRTRCILDIDLPHDLSRLLPANCQPMGELLTIYVDLSTVQGGIIPYLQGRSVRHDADRASLLHSVKSMFMQQMQDIHRRIEKIASKPSLWKGMDTQTEVSALKFAYHSIMTAILQVFETSDTPEKPYLHSARQELSALVSMCLSADKQSVVAFLHWTLLYYPLTAYFALFCNVVATSDMDDFALMKAISDCLDKSGTTSKPISQLQILFEKFLSMSSSLFNVSLGSQRTPTERVQDLQLRNIPPSPASHPMIVESGPFLTSLCDDTLALNHSTVAELEHQIEPSNFLATLDYPFLLFNDSMPSFLGDGSDG